MPAFCSLNWIQGVIVSAAVIGAAGGSALGGALGDFVGRKKTLLVGDALFAAGAILMAAAQGAGVLIAGQPYAPFWSRSLASLTIDSSAHLFCSCLQYLDVKQERRVKVLRSLSQSSAHECTPVNGLAECPG